jgi:hypothetical protein
LKIQGNPEVIVFPVTFTMNERVGATFKARYTVATNIREIRGTIKEGRIYWHPRDVKAIEGDAGYETAGMIEGGTISLTISGFHFEGGQPVSGTVILQRVKSRGKSLRLARYGNKRYGKCVNSVFSRTFRGRSGAVAASLFK